MGYELQAKVVPPVEPLLLQTALKEKFTSLQWAIVRSDRSTFSAAYANRTDTTWDEDFVIGVGYTLEEAVNQASSVSENDAADARQTIVYLLDHGGGSGTPLIMPLVNEVAKTLGSQAVWEEL